MLGLRCDVSALQQIDGLIAAGEMPTAIARLTGIQKDRIVRHRKHALRSTAPTTDPDTRDELAMSDERLNRWLLRSEELYQASISQADLRGAVESLRSGIRAEVEWRRRHEAHVEQAAAYTDSEKDGAPSVAWLDRIVRRVREAKAETGMKTNCELQEHSIERKLHSEQ